jgi:quinohemoprotein ethanol dehydrogenase
MVIANEPNYKWKKGDANLGSSAVFGNFSILVPKSDQDAMAAIIKATPGIPSVATREVLIAWDPVAQKERWRAATGNEEWAGGGVLTTAGNLVIQGTSSGHLIVYRADTGEKLKDIEVGTAMMAAPVTYQIDGEQYVAVFAGFGGALAPMYPKESAPYRYQNYGRILAFKLGGGPTPLPPARAKQATPEPPALANYSDSLADRGGPIFQGLCMGCHAGRGEGRLSAYPDLNRLPAATHAAFDSIVLGGKYRANGMSSFGDLLKPADVAAIHAYLVREQRKLWNEENGRP